jgi:hypothetical protein
MRTSAKPGGAGSDTAAPRDSWQLNASAVMSDDAFFSLGVSLAHDLACGFLGHHRRFGRLSRFLPSSSRYRACRFDHRRCSNTRCRVHALTVRQGFIARRQRPAFGLYLSTSWRAHASATAAVTKGPASRRSRERTHLVSPLLALEVRKRECGGGGSSMESIGGPRASRSDRHESDAAMRGGLPVDARG